MVRDDFESRSDLAEYMIDKMQDGFYVVSTLFSNDAIALLRELLSYIDLKVGIIDVKNSNVRDYDKEYYVSLSSDGYVSAEPAYVDGRYLITDADLMLIDGDASSKVLSCIDEERCHEIYIAKHGSRDNF